MTRRMWYAGAVVLVAFAVLCGLIAGRYINLSYEVLMLSPLRTLATVSVERRLLLLSGSVQDRGAFEEKLTEFVAKNAFSAASSQKGADGLPSIARLYRSPKGIDMLVAETGGMMAISLLTEQKDLDLPQPLRVDVADTFEKLGLKVNDEQ